MREWEREGGSECEGGGEVFKFDMTNYIYCKQPALPEPCAEPVRRWWRRRRNAGRCGRRRRHSRRHGRRRRQRRGARCQSTPQQPSTSKYGTKRNVTTWFQ